MKSLKLFALFCFLVITNQHSFAQCYPASAAIVFGTTSGVDGAETFANMPTGTVIELVAPVDRTTFLIDFCSTNPGPGTYPSGTNDGYATILDANSPTAIELRVGDDGCTNIDTPGYGPPVFSFIADTAGTYYLYLTEYDALGDDQCFGNDGSNSSYIAQITTTLPPPVDIALNSTIGFSKIPVFLKNDVNFTANAFNLGFNASTYTIKSAVYQLPGQASSFNTSASLSISNFDTVLNASSADVSAINSAGNYRALFIADAVNDTIESNDTATYDFQFTADIYSRGTDSVENTNPLSTGNPNDNISAVQPFSFSAAVLVSEIYFEKLSRAQPVLDSVQAIILQTTTNGKPGALFYASPMKLASSLNNGRVGIGIPNPISLPSGTYFIGFRNVLDTSGVGVFAICRDNYEPNSLYVKANFTGSSFLDADSLQGTSFNFCMDIQVAEDPNVGINEMKANEVYLYPNPANNQVNMVLQNNIASESNLRVFNIAGKLLNETTLAANTLQTTLDVSNFSNGIYVVEITNKTDKINKKLTINR